MKSINILGPFSTGTNLINNIIKDATNINITKIIDKHTIDFSTLENAVKNNPDVLFIAMYRPLFSWVESMKKYSYDLKWDKKNITTQATLYKNNYDNVTHVYNKYYSNYMKLINTYPNIISMRYYSLVHPDLCCSYVLSKLNPFFHIKKNTTKDFCYKLNITLKKPSKSHGHTVNNNNQAIKNFVKLQNESKHKYNNFEDNTITTFFEKY
jgi:hypothetical protein